MPGLPFLMSADLHGVEAQYRALLDLAVREGVKRVFVSGDLVDAPDVMAYEGFWRERLFPMLEECVAETGPLFVTMGNHDFASAVPYLETRPDLVQVLHQRAHALGEGLTLVGYPYTTPTPHWVKDFEKWDTTEPPIDRYVPDGLVSRGRGTEVFTLKALPRSDNLAEDLTRLGRLVDPRRTVYLMHQPPSDTPLDVLQGGRHIGSKAVRGFLEVRQPYLTLHGHVHETVDETGVWSVWFGKALAVSVGNLPSKSELTVVGGDLCDRASLRRRRVRIGG